MNSISLLNINLDNLPEDPPHIIDDSLYSKLTNGDLRTSFFLDDKFRKSSAIGADLFVFLPPALLGGKTQVKDIDLQTLKDLSAKDLRANLGDELVTKLKDEITKHETRLKKDINKKTDAHTQNRFDLSRTTFNLVLYGKQAIFSAHKSAMAELPSVTLMENTGASHPNYSEILLPILRCYGFQGYTESTDKNGATSRNPVWDISVSSHIPKEILDLLPYLDTRDVSKFRQFTKAVEALRHFLRREVSFDDVATELSRQSLLSVSADERLEAVLTAFHISPEECVELTSSDLALLPQCVEQFLIAYEKFSTGKQELENCIVESLCFERILSFISKSLEEAANEIKRDNDDRIILETRKKNMSTMANRKEWGLLSLTSFREYYDFSPLIEAYNSAPGDEKTSFIAGLASEIIQKPKGIFESVKWAVYFIYRNAFLMPALHETICSELENLEYWEKLEGEDRKNQLEALIYRCGFACHALPHVASARIIDLLIGVLNPDETQSLFSQTDELRVTLETRNMAKLLDKRKLGFSIGKDVQNARYAALELNFDVLARQLGEDTTNDTNEVHLKI